jgi:peptide/nickel transport system substrate-binding protein
MRESGSSRKVSRRVFLSRSLAVLGAGFAATTLLAACGPATPAAPTTAPAKPAAEPTKAPAAGGPTTAPAQKTAPAETKPAAKEGEPVRGGNVLFVHQQIPSSMDANVWTATNAARIMRQIYDPLIWQPEGGKFAPGLAEKWDLSPDGKTYTFSLRKDVKFHDGTPFNATAVKATYDRINDPATKSLQSGRLGPYDRTEVADEYTVKIVLKEPFTPLLSNLSEHALAPASSAAVQKLGSKYAMNPVATGPFKVKEWPDNNTLVLERNTDYKWAPSFWANQGAAYLDTITYRFAEEPATRQIALENGEADIVDAPPAQDYKRIKDSGKFTTNDLIVPGMPEFNNINITRPPTNELAVRKAILHAVDRQALADLVFFGVYPPAYGPLTKGSWAYSKELESMYPYDPAKAKQLLDGAGWKEGSGGIRTKDGKPLRVRHITTAGGFTQKAAEFVQAQLREVGFDAVVEAMAYEATVKRFTDNEYELYRLFFALIDPHDSFFLAYHSSQIEGGGQFNRTRVQDPKLDALIMQGGTETDVTKRKEIYAQIQKEIMEQAYILPNFDTVLIHAMQKHVRGFSTDLLGRPYMSSVWKAK